MSYVIQTDDDGDIKVPADLADTPLASFLGEWDDEEEKQFVEGLDEIEAAERDAQVVSAVLKFA